MPAMTALMFSTFGCSICFRLKARSCRVSPAARVARFLDLEEIRAPRDRPADSPSIISSLKPRMTVSTLLKSCATPPASCPTASSFCAWRSCSSSRRCCGHVAAGR